MSFVAFPLAAVLLILALVHVYWTVFGVGTGAAVPSHADGTPVIRPGRVASLIVAVALLVGTLIVLARAHVLTVGVPSIMIRVGIWAMASAFAARTVGEFRYVGLFKRVRGTQFATWDTRFFTPLCAVIATAAVVVVMTSE